MVSTLDDAGALVPRAQAGDTAAVNEILLAVRSAVLRYSRSRLSTYSGGAEVSEDVTQEVCLAVADVLPRYVDRGAPFGALVYAIAANKVADAQRRYGRDPWFVVDELPEEPDDPDGRPEQRLAAGLDLEEARRLVDALPTLWARIVWMRAEGYSAGEVGDAVGMNANQVRVTHHRALKRLRASV